ncbi:MAG: hypothetical protein M3005_03330 [Apilactobacillus sp.]|uniref:hypothetical protein n=1 Tax=Apilactobacillus TaxID=2767877 RepID=UPI0025EDB590|nr:hypothetical protein [Apilactobacillus sp.]MCT6822887.1 hypothetical protein [Apilactobacillus sp.]
MNEDNSQLIEKITKNISDGKYQLAANQAKDYLEIKPNEEIEVLLVQSLFQLKQYIEAKKEVIEFPNAFIKNEKDFALMLKVLIKNDEFIKAREIVVSLKSEELFFNVGMNLIEKAEEDILMNSAESVRQQAQKYYHISNKQTLYWQKEAFLAGQHLPYVEFVKYSRFVLMDPFVQSIIKSEVIDTLRKVGCEDNVDMLWIDKTSRKVELSNVKSLDEMESYKYIHNKLLEDYMSDPEKMMLLGSYFQHQAILMYPFNDEIIYDYKRWYRLSLESYLTPEKYDLSGEDDYQKYIEIIKREFSLIK